MAGDGYYRNLTSFGTASANPFIYFFGPVISQSRPTCLNKQRSQERIAPFAYPACPIHCAGLITSRRKADIITDLPATLEAVRVVNDRDNRLGCARTDTRDGFKQLNRLFLLRDSCKASSCVSSICNWPRQRSQGSLILSKDKAIC